MSWFYLSSVYKADDLMHLPQFMKTIEGQFTSDIIMTRKQLQSWKFMMDIILYFRKLNVNMFTEVDTHP